MSARRRASIASRASRRNWGRACTRTNAALARASRACDCRVHGLARTRAGSSAAVTARPTTSTSAPAAATCSGVPTRAWSLRSSDASRTPGTIVTKSRRARLHRVDFVHRAHDAAATRGRSRASSRDVERGRVGVAREHGDAERNGARVSGRRAAPSAIPSTPARNIVDAARGVEVQVRDAETAEHARRARRRWSGCRAASGRRTPRGRGAQRRRSPRDRRRSTARGRPSRRRTTARGRRARSTASSRSGTSSAIASRLRTSVSTRTASRSSWASWAALLR